MFVVFHHNFEVYELEKYQFISKYFCFRENSDSNDMKE